MSEYDYLESDFEKLKEKNILSIEWNEQTLRFNLYGDAVIYSAVGDCCSSSYIESLDNPEIFKNAKFISVEVAKGDTKEVEDEEGYEQFHKWTFYKFKTDKGMCTLSFRNESNGYYDGQLELQP